MPHEQEILDHEEKLDADIIREQQAQIQARKYDLAKANYMVAFLK